MSISEMYQYISIDTGLYLDILTYVKTYNLIQGLTFVGYASGFLLLVIYVARLTVLDPANPVLLYPVLINGFILSPIWYLWIGLVYNKK